MSSHSSLTILCLAISVLGSTTLAQDPTVPSSQILERLNSRTPTQLPGRTPEPATELVDLPTIKLKAIVMNDRDSGTALVEINGRRLRLSLKRNSPEQINAPELSGIEISGTVYRVEDFTSRSILLNGQGRRLLVN